MKVSADLSQSVDGDSGHPYGLQETAMRGLASKACNSVSTRAKEKNRLPTSKFSICEPVVAQTRDIEADMPHGFEHPSPFADLQAYAVGSGDPAGQKCDALGRFRGMLCCHLRHWLLQRSPINMPPAVSGGG